MPKDETQSIRFSDGYENHKRIDQNLLCDDALADPVVHEIADELTAVMDRSKLTGTQLRHLKTILLNLARNQSQDFSRYTSYSRTSGKYKKSRYNWMGYRPTIEICDALVAIEYAEKHVGYFDRETNRGKESRLRATSDLRPHLVQMGQVSKGWGELIQLKEPVPSRSNGRKTSKARKRLVDFEETESTTRMRAFIAEYNYHLQNADIRLSNSGMVKMSELGRPVEFDEKFVNRIFQDRRFDRYGRYNGGWWQNCYKGLRPHIIINGFATAEHDFNSPQIHFLYGMNDTVCSHSDPYVIQGFEDRREDMKIVFTRSVNNDNSRSFQLSCKQRGISDSLKLVEAFYAAHPVISEFKFAKMGNELMYYESEVATYVMERCMSDGVIVLGIHDSFVGYLDYDLPSVMREGFRKLGWKSVPNIKTITAS